MKTSAQNLGKRLIHTAPKLKLQDEFIKNGINGLYSSQGFKLAWIDYQNYLTKNLTLLTNGTIDETRYPFSIAIANAKDSSKQNIFNIASQTHNNHFFFQQLISSQENNTSPSRELNSRIISKFGSLDSLVDQFVLESKEIIGQGWIFLIENESKNLEILTLNNSGTPYNFSGNHSLDLNGPIGLTELEAWESIKESTLTKAQDWTLPLLGISLWDHSFITDYGVDGRDEYIKDVFKNINWDVVNKRLYVQ
ncbi:Superoxide dismutase [Mn], mitochondrial [Wickerhamomyces ciferrii]|uniref:Superoxide dismutase [Mn], mitochondrial n=1 Tax=Wickerhamomyces ciferrii (strain ATCC 14091 / BCRC 22168 / CBS 111 / JCM 3599 / NBRC 0793 / NRRL Y-1031 F-60-10) TaxID=1206466 RepID=K0KKU9_WICCF|nr:Superoxide dismutase [Mn], mitochondrial [Wickerhamomyces ciferrii]CCH42089.1 Superoxide dismutase [Mn], mitochondrial [Wickerhamomyces ciferrii]